MIVAALLSFILGMVFATVVIWHGYVAMTRRPEYWEGFFRGVVKHPVARPELDKVLWKERNG